METKRKLYIAAAVLIVLVVALGLLTACTSESLVAYEAPAVSTAPASYTLTVQASKGEAVTRALLLNNENTPQESLDAVWKTTETIDVYKGDTKVGELTPQEDNVAQTLLKGEVSNVAVNDVLTLKFLSPDYATQSGTLEYIAANCDYATASVTVLGIDGTDVTTTGADFENQQSIVKFTLQDKDNSNAAISATEMTVIADGHTYSIQTTSATNEFFVALPSFSEKAIQVTASNSSDIYTFDCESTTLESGKYYTLTMQMSKGNLVNLSTLEGNYTAKNGDILTGTIENTKKITIAAGASITLYNASINANENDSGNTSLAGITCLGNATITLVGTNVVNSCGNDYPGIQAGGDNTTLTINGTGSLTATGGYYAAGIGSPPEVSCGNISISGGTITATGGYGGAGIGSGAEGGRCGDITISGGTITATGGMYAAGIGSGEYGSCGNISISGTASGTATGGLDSPCDIGPALEGTCGTISVQANTISGTYYGMVVDLSTLTADYVAKDGAVLTGTIDNTKKITIAAGASITLYNVSINANGIHSDATKWAGITCEGNATITLVGTNEVNSCENGYPGIQAGGEGTTLTIDGTGSLNATGGYGGAGIGSGDHDSCGNISISGGTINATGGYYAAGIGSGDHGRCGNISITGGNITATGDVYAAGIGSGSYGSCVNITISGTASGSATGGFGSSYDIGPGKDGSCGTVSLQANIISGTCYGMVNLSTLEGNYTAQSGDILTGTIDHTKKISIAAGASITLYNVSINAGGADSNNSPWAGLTCLGNATITLVGTNEVNSCEIGYPGIQAGGEGTTLTINGTGSLNATGGYYAAGIGSRHEGSCGNISITGGKITATGGDCAAGIGSGNVGTCGNISISGGNITATGGSNAAGIGSGGHGSCGDISINDGTVTATGGYLAAGIGSGNHGSCGNISITGGTITATGGENAAGIGSGSGDHSSCGNITISGTASGTATGGKDSPCDISPGKDGTCGTVSVADNTISGSYLGQPITCTFTVNFQSDGALNNMVKTDKITITCNGKTYTALRADEVGSYIRTGVSVQGDLPIGNNMLLTFTAECTFVTNSNPVGTFSATIGNVTITSSSSTLNEVTLVKQ